jgi:hypothetical protein
MSNDEHRLEVAWFASICIDIRHPAGLIGPDGVLYSGDYFFDLVLDDDKVFADWAQEMLSVSEVEGAA